MARRSSQKSLSSLNIFLSKALAAKAHQLEIWSGRTLPDQFFIFVLQGVRILFFCEEVFNHSLGGEASELVDIRASCGQERSSNSAALGSQNVTMGAGNFADQTVST